MLRKKKKMLLSSLFNSTKQFIEKEHGSKMYKEIIIKLFTIFKTIINIQSLLSLLELHLIL